MARRPIEEAIQWSPQASPKTALVEIRQARATAHQEAPDMLELYPRDWDRREEVIREIAQEAAKAARSYALVLRFGSEILAVARENATS